MVTSRLKYWGLTTALGFCIVACGGGQSGSASQLPADSPQVSLTQPPPRVGVGIGGLSYWDRSFAMADVARQAQARGLDWSYDVSADADGNPGKDFQLIYSATKISAGTYKLRFTGRATVTTGAAGAVQNLSYDVATNRSSADIVLSTDVVGNVWLVFKDTYRSKASAKGDGLTHIQLWRPGYATDGSALFTTEFLAAMKKFKLVRGMEFVSANTNAQTSWNERTTPGFFGSTGSNGQSWELLVALANASDRDVWLNVPVKADDDYIRKLAQLVKFGSDGNKPYSNTQATPIFAPLKPGLNVYLEYGNEVWNSGGGFYGFGWALALANAFKGDTTHPIAFDKAQTDQYIALRRWIAYRSASISLTFRDVFGDDAMMSTVRPILAGQAGNGNLFLSLGLQWAQAFYGQVRQAAPRNAVARQPSDIWYGGGGAAYYDATIDPKDTKAATLDAYFASLPTPTFARLSTADSIWTHAFGLKYVSYEGGPGPGGSALGSIAGAVVSPVFNNDSRMKDRMLVAQDIWDQAGGDELVYYVYSGSAPWSFTNELQQQVFSDTSSVKLQAVDAINAKSRPAVTLGNLVPGRIYLKDPATQTIASDAASWAQGGTVYLLRPSAVSPSPYILVPFRVAVAGEYKISLNIATKVTGTVALFVNGASYGTINLAPDATNTATVSSKVVVTLPAGLSVLRLDTPKANGDIFVKDVVVE
ncbi:MAG: hypothetical protein ABIZ09_07455 [Rhodoferax sp.]